MIKIRDFIRKYQQLTFFIGLLIVGVVFSIVGVISLKEPKIDGIEVEAKIVNIEEEKTGEDADGLDTYDYHVYVDYTDKDGVEHSNVESYKYSSSMKVGDTINVEYNPENPEEIVHQSLIGDIIFIIVGLVCVIVSIVKIVKTIKNKNINEYNQVDMSKVTEGQIESIKNNKEEEKEYYFHFTGKLNQSYIMETPNRYTIYEAKCEKMGVVKDAEFTFINHITGEETKHLVGHTVEVSYNDFITSSNAKIDGVNVWKTIGEKGYSLEPHLNGLKTYFDVLHYGVRVGKIELAGTNILKEGKTSKLGEIPGVGLFKIYAKESDIDIIFFCGFVLSKVKFY